MPSEIAALGDNSDAERLALSQEQSAEIKKLEIQSSLEQARIIGSHMEATDRRLDSADRRQFEYAMDRSKKRQGLFYFYPLLAVAAVALVLWILPESQRPDALQTLLTFGGGALTGFGGGAWWYNRPSRRKPPAAP